jgi:hypothetical protein
LIFDRALEGKKILVGTNQLSASLARTLASAGAFLTVQIVRAATGGKPNQPKQRGSNPETEGRQTAKME